MKLIVLFLSLLVTTNIFAQGDDPINMRFWDGTFAYNQLLVETEARNPSFVNFTLTGSQIDLGGQLN